MKPSLRERLKVHPYTLENVEGDSEKMPLRENRVYMYTYTCIKKDELNDLSIKSTAL